MKRASTKLYAYAFKNSTLEFIVQAYNVDQNRYMHWKSSIYLLYQTMMLHQTERDLCVQFLETKKENGIAGQQRLLFGVQARTE